MTIAIDTETTGLFIHKGCRAFNISAADDDANEYLWKFRVNPKTREVQYIQKEVDHFRKVLSQHKEVVFHNGNFDIQALDPIGVTVDYLEKNHDIHDTMVMAHAWESDCVKGLKELTLMLLDFPEDDEKRLAKATQSAWKKAKKLGWTVSDKNNPHYTLRGTQKEWWRGDYWLPEEYARYERYSKEHEWRHICDEYAKKDAVRTIGIYEVLKEMMNAQQLESYDKARQLIIPLIKMQYEKITVLPEELKKAKDKYYQQTNTQLRKIRKLVGDKGFNPKSPQQLRHVLFTKFKFKPTKKTKTGNVATDKDVIHKLLEDCPLKKLPNKFQFLIELKKLRKVQTTSTFVQNYDTHKNKHNELQAFFKQWSTGTNRLSAENPNPTNVGKKDPNNPFGEEPGLEHLKGLIEADDSFKLRNVFGPRKGEQWTCIDYEKSQLLIFAVVSNSKPLLRAFELGLDPHDEVAKELFKKSNISAVERTAAKTINFGILFGAGPGKIEQIAGMPGLYSLFLAQFPEARKYLDLQSKQARRKGYVYTLGGYRLYVPQERPYAASCYVIQGTEAEMVRAAMVNISKYTYHKRIRDFIKAWNTGDNQLDLLTTTTSCKYRMIMMVHDELVFRSKTANNVHLENIQRIMVAEGLRLGIPAQVSADIVTKNWGEKEELELAT